MNYALGWICIFFFFKRIFKIKTHITLKPWTRAGINNGVQQSDVKKATCIIASFLLFFCFKKKTFPFGQGGKEYLMRAHFGLPSVEAEDKEGKPPISVKFEIPYFTTSGIQVSD